MKTYLPALLLGLCLFTVTFAVNLQAPLYGAYAAQSDAGAAAVTIAFAAYVAGLMPTLLLFGGLSDRIGRKAPIIAALVLATLATAMLVIRPDWTALLMARCLLGVGTGLATTTGAAWMAEILSDDRAKGAALAATSATSLGFGGGALATGISLGMQGQTLFPASFKIMLILAPCLALLALCLPRAAGKASAGLLRLPVFPRDTWVFGVALALAWATTGMTIAVVPLELARNGLGSWSGLVIFLAIFVGFLCQPIARRLTNETALGIGFFLVPAGFIVLLVGMRLDLLAIVLVGTCITSAASYGFTYLAALAAVCARATNDRAKATAGLFVYAYAGFSLPVITSGVLADMWGMLPAMAVFAAATSATTLIVVVIWKRPAIFATGKPDQQRTTAGP